MANTIDFSSTSVGRFGASSQVDSEEGISASELGMTDSELLQGSHQKRGRDACAKFSLSFWRVAKSWWKTAVIILTPVLFSPLPIVIRDPAANAAYVIFIIAVYWMTEALPLVVTSLLPLVLFPILGVLSAKDVGVAFLNDTNWLFAGGLMVAIAVEKWDLHKRLALLVLLLMGSRPSMLLLGFMCSTGFLSMWLSNTATAAMMLPIAQAVLNEFEKCAEELSSSGGQVVAIGYRRLGNENGNEDGNRSGDRTLSELGDEELSEKKNTETSPEEPNEQISLTPEAANTGTETTSYNSTSRGADDADLGSAKVSKNETVKRLGKGLMIGVAYAANIGGMATLTGTGPNLVLRGVVNDLFPQSSGINFGVWFLFGVPTAVIALFGTWAYLTVLFCDDSFRRIKKKLCFKWQMDIIDAKKGRNVIKSQYRLLGSITYAEVVVLLLFTLLALLWFLRDPKFIPGWGSLFPTAPDGTSYVSDASAAIFVVVLLFLLPSKPCVLCRKCRHCSCSLQTCVDAGKSERLLDWDSVHHKLPWNVILLLGCGFAMARAAQCSGLSQWIGLSLHGLNTLPVAAVAFLVSCLVGIITQVISNVATTTLFLPILAELGVSLKVNPLYLMVPATVAASLAFMLPVSTPPNAMAFAFGYIRASDMVLTGIPVNLFSIGVLTFAVHTYGTPLFNLNTVPEWSMFSNVTANLTYC